MPARLEFEQCVQSSIRPRQTILTRGGNSEFDNDAEVLIKDMEFGLVMRYGGASQPKAGAEWAPETSDVKVKQEDEATSSSSQPSASETPATAADGTPAGSTTGGGGGGGDDEASNAGEQLVEEDEEDLDLKLAILDIYNERINKRIEIKSLLFDRNLIDYRKVHPSFVPKFRSDYADVRVVGF